MANPHDNVNIIIDKDHKTSPNPTTGAALYLLGGVQAGFKLFKEVHGPGNDDPIPNDATVITLKNGDHFYTTKDELNPGQ